MITCKIELDGQSGWHFFCFFFAYDNSHNDNQPLEALQPDPNDWKTGDEPMTPAQRSYLETLSADVGEEA
jgi:hypothetical protein